MNPKIGTQEPGLSATIYRILNDSQEELVNSKIVSGVSIEELDRQGLVQIQRRIQADPIPGDINPMADEYLPDTGVLEFETFPKDRVSVSHNPTASSCRAVTFKCTTWFPVYISVGLDSDWYWRVGTGPNHWWTSQIVGLIDQVVHVWAGSDKPSFTYLFTNSAIAINYPITDPGKRRIRVQAQMESPSACGH